MNPTPKMFTQASSAIGSAGRVGKKPTRQDDMCKDCPKGQSLFSIDCPFFVPMDIVSKEFFKYFPEESGGIGVKAHRRILLYGNSVILGTIGASLRRFPEFDVTALKTPLSDMQVLDEAKPDILFFDLEAPHAEAVFSLLKTHPTLHLIGISPGINLVDVWSGRQLRDLSMQGLLDLIQNAADDLPVESGASRDGSCRGA